MNTTLVSSGMLCGLELTQISDSKMIEESVYLERINKLHTSFMETS